MRIRHLGTPGTLRGTQHQKDGYSSRKLKNVLQATRQTLVAAQCAVNRLEMLFNTLPVGAHILDTRGVIKKVNDSEAEMLGRPKNELVGRSFLELIPEEQRTEAWQRFQAKIGGQRVNPIAHRTYERPDGERLFVFSEDRLLTDRTGRVTGILTVLHNITELNQLHASSARAQKLEALGQVAAGVAHNFNNFLCAISGHAQMIRYTATDKGTKEDAAAILDSCERGVDITRGLLSFTQKAVIDNITVDKPTNAVRQAIQDLKDSDVIHDNNIRVTEVYETEARVKADMRQISKAVRNLLLNSIASIQAACQENGLITVSVYEHEYQIKQDTVSDRLLRPGPYVVISVQDNGPGIPEEIQGRVFDPFFSSEGVLRTGLGLSEVLGIAESTGGGVKLSGVAHGTKIKIFLPVLTA